MNFIYLEFIKCLVCAFISKATIKMPKKIKINCKGKKKEQWIWTRITGRSNYLLSMGCEGSSSGKWKPPSTCSVFLFLGSVAAGEVMMEIYYVPPFLVFFPAGLVDRVHMFGSNLRLVAFYSGESSV